MRGVKTDFNSLIGKVYGGYTIVGIGKKVGYHQRLKCKCNLCGKINEVRAYNVMRGTVGGCRCRIKVHTDIVGKRYGRLTIIREVERQNGRRMVEAKCDCGKIIKCNLINLACGHPVSCGCYFYDKMKETRKYGEATRKMRLYTIWLDIQGRVKGHAGRKHYYDRGIKCERKNFEEFKNDMEDSYNKHVEEYGEKQTSIDRIDVDGNYSKNNCRRATRAVQNSNKRKNKLITNSYT